jgi:hypothetical protein
MDSTNAVFIAVLVVVSLLYLTVIPLYLIKRKTFPIAQRLPWYAVIQMIAMVGISFFTLTQQIVPVDSFLKNCRFYSFCTTLFMYISTIMFGFRAGWLLLKDFVTRNLISQYTPPKILGRSSKMPQQSFEEVYPELMRRILMKQIYRIGVFPTLITYIIPLFIIMFCDVSLTLKGASPNLQISDPQCLPGFQNTFYVTASSFAYVGLFSLLLLRYLWKIEDSFKMAAELGLVAICGTGWVVFLVITGFVDGLPAQLHLVSGGLVSPSFVCALSIFPIVMSFRTEKDVKQKSKKKNQLQQSLVKTNKIANAAEEFRILLDDSEGVDLFFQFLQSELSVENLIFYLKSVEYSQKAAEGLHDESQSIAMYIKEQFVADRCQNPVNISYTVRKKLLLDLDSEVRPLSSNIFDEAQKQIFSLLKFDSFSRFRHKKEYQDWAWNQEMEFSSFNDTHVSKVDSDRKKLNNNTSAIEVSLSSNSALNASSGFLAKARDY